MTASPITLLEAEALLAPLARFPQVALAVSGGPDSLALMHLAVAWRAERAGAPALTVLTVDHGLRQSSRREAELVGRMAEELDLPHAVLNWKSSGPQAPNLQARARAARYDLMADFCHANGILALVTAHHLDDQAETFLMRLKRGSGLDGLAAIPERGEWAGIAVLRPLLDVPKSRLVATLDAAGIGFVSDPSNSDPRFERARVRASTNALTALGLTPEALALSARRLRRAREALDRAAQDFLATGSEISAAGYALIDRDALASAPEEIALRGLARLIGAVGGSETPLRLVKLETLLTALHKDPDKGHTLGRCRVEPCAGRLGIFREMRRTGLPKAKLRPGERLLWDNRFQIELGASEADPIVVKALGELDWRALRDRSKLAAALPRLAGRTLPSCWRGKELLGLPRLGRAGKTDFGLDCTAYFISAGNENGGNG